VPSIAEPYVGRPVHRRRLSRRQVRPSAARPAVPRQESPRAFTRIRSRLKRVQFESPTDRRARTGPPRPGSRNESDMGTGSSAQAPSSSRSPRGCRQDHTCIRRWVTPALPSRRRTTWQPWTLVPGSGGPASRGCRHRGKGGHVQAIPELHRRASDSIPSAGMVTPNGTYVTRARGAGDATASREGV